MADTVPLTSGASTRSTTSGTNVTIFFSPNPEITGDFVPDGQRRFIQVLQIITNNSGTPSVRNTISLNLSNSALGSGTGVDFTTEWETGGRIIFTIADTKYVFDIADATRTDTSEPYVIAFPEAQITALYNAIRTARLSTSLVFLDSDTIQLGFPPAGFKLGFGGKTYNKVQFGGKTYNKMVFNGKTY